MTTAPSKNPTTAEHLTDTDTTVTAMIDALAQRGSHALHAFADFSQEQINTIVHAMAIAGVDQHMELAALAVEEAGRGLRSEEHTSELQSRGHLVCRPRLETKQ